VGHLQVCEIAGLEPAKIVVLLGCGVDRFPFPSRDKEHVHVEGGVIDHHRDGQRVVDVDTEFLEALPTDGLVKRLARLDMSADEAQQSGYHRRDGWRRTRSTRPSRTSAATVIEIGVTIGGLHRLRVTAVGLRRG